VLVVSKDIRTFVLFNNLVMILIYFPNYVKVDCFFRFVIGVLWYVVILMYAFHRAKHRRADTLLTLIWKIIVVHLGVPSGHKIMEQRNNG
jgi:hypothetical protein